MLVYRISKRIYINDLSGEGARKYGGRWNEKGTPLVYTSGSISLAMLESLVHFPVTLIPNDLSIASILIPDKISKAIIDIHSLGTLPQSWREYPPTIQTQRFIQKWIQEKKSLVLKVPSAINISEFNYLLNPTHKDMKLVSINSTSVFSFDSRLIASEKKQT